MNQLALAERRDFAAFLETLTPPQWDAATLCEGWTVREVVAHVVSYDELRIPQLFARWRAARAKGMTANDYGVEEYRHRPLAELIARMALGPGGLTAAFGARIGLLDGMIHQQDIRRPLRMPRDIPEARLHRALNMAMVAPPIGATRRVRGLRLVATDIDWHHGKGPEVRGPAEALLLAAAGRDVVCPELDGPGAVPLSQRMP